MGWGQTLRTPGVPWVSGGTLGWGKGPKGEKASSGRGCGLWAKSEHYIKGQEHELVPALVSVSIERMGLIILILIICCI